MFIGTIQPTFAKPFNPGASAGATPWYLSGGISSANCVAAYQPKGAGSLALSYKNIANPGTYDAAPGTAPTWDATNGWIFNAANSQYLTTGLTAPSVTTWSAFVRFSNTTTGVNVGLFGSRTSTRWYILFNSSTSIAITNDPSQGTQTVFTVGVITSGIAGFAGLTAYMNGASQGAITGSSGTVSSIVYIGNIEGRSYFITSDIQALCIYNTTLTGAQVTALNTAMNLL